VGFAADASELAEVAARATKVGGGTVEGPAPTPWNTIDLVARDADGYTVVLTGYGGHRNDEMQTALDNARVKGWEGADTSSA
jgi:hypothetical protein